MSIYDNPQNYAEEASITIEQATLRCKYFKELEAKIHEARKCPRCGEYTLEFEGGSYEENYRDYVYCTNENIPDNENGEGYYVDCDFTSEIIDQFELLSTGYNFDVVLCFGMNIKSQGLQKVEKEIGCPWSKFVDKNNLAVCLNAKEDLVIYIAGFDVFKPNAKEIGDEYKKECEKHGFKALFPLDNEIDLDKSNAVKTIFHGNIDYINKSHIIIANLNHFRGAEPDSGTSFECGYGYAKNKVIYGYIGEDISLIERVKKYYGTGSSLNKDKDGLSIENFKLNLNLMLSVPTNIVIGDFKDCLEKVKRDVYYSL